MFLIILPHPTLMEQWGLLIKFSLLSHEYWVWGDNFKNLLSPHPHCLIRVGWGVWWQCKNIIDMYSLIRSWWGDSMGKILIVNGQKSMEIKWGDCVLGMCYILCMKIYPQPPLFHECGAGKTFKKNQ